MNYDRLQENKEIRAIKASYKLGNKYFTIKRLRYPNEIKIRFNTAFIEKNGFENETEPCKYVENLLDNLLFWSSKISYADFKIFKRQVFQTDENEFFIEYYTLQED